RATISRKRPTSSVPHLGKYAGPRRVGLRIFLRFDWVLSQSFVYVFSVALPLVPLLISDVLRLFVRVSESYPVCDLQIWTRFGITSLAMNTILKWSIPICEMPRAARLGTETPPLPSGA